MTKERAKTATASATRVDDQVGMSAEPSPGSRDRRDGEKEPLDLATDDPRQNSQIYNATRKQGEVTPEDYPDREKGSVVGSPNLPPHERK